MKRTRVFAVSNGYGEDMIACRIIREIKDRSAGCEFYALPLVGEGNSYANSGIPVLGPRRLMPSGGFARMGPGFFLRDLKAGLLGSILSQISVIKEESARSDLVLTVGDTFLCALCGFFGKKKANFVATAQSAYIRDFLWIDFQIMKSFSKVVFPRDGKTAARLEGKGINTVSAGNVMMDCMEFSGERFGIAGGRKVITLLPGSRDEAYGNLKHILGVVDEISLIGYKENREVPVFLLAAAPSLKPEIIRAVAGSAGWTCGPADQEPGTVGSIFKKGSRVIITENFPDAVACSDLVIGLSGTGNEQAVGLGKPVIAFPGDGPQMTLGFLKDQSRLLGGLVFILPRKPDVAARKAIEILNNSEITKTAEKAGPEIMGAKGAAGKIAAYIVSEIPACL